MIDDAEIKSRVNKKLNWYSVDSEERYNPNQPDGRGLNYPPVDAAITYKFNSDGFRCDHFTEQTTLPILFMGCSFTEGIGLPLETVWSHLFLNAIRRQNPDKKIPYWSIALHACGIDTQARLLVDTGYKIKPKYIFYHLSSHYRREYCYENYEPKLWVPNFKLGTEADLAFTKLAIDQSFAMHQCWKSLCLINLLAEKYGSTVVIFQTKADIDVESERALYSKFNNISYLRIGEDDLLSKWIPNFTKLGPSLARDNLHPGFWWQTLIYENLYRQLPDSIKLNLGISL